MMLQRKIAPRLFGAAIWLLTFGVAAIPLVSVNPESRAVILGDAATVDVVVSALGTFSAPSVSVYDIDIRFDPMVLAVSSVSFGNQLDLFGLGSLQVLTGTEPINIFELSFDTPADLNDLQLPSFTLFSVTFATIAVGTSELDLMVNTLADAFGAELIYTATGGTISVMDTVIPVPPPLALVFLGLAGLIADRVGRRGKYSKLSGRNARGTGSPFS